MIESLTSKQEAQLEPYVQKWLKIGLSTEPCNVERSKHWIRKAYQVARLKPPAKWVLCDSPLACAQAQIKHPVGSQVQAQVWDQVREKTSDRVWKQIWGQVEDLVWIQVLDQVWHQVRTKVYNQVSNQVGEQVWDQVREPVAYGAHDAPWLGEFRLLLKSTQTRFCETTRTTHKSRQTLRVVGTL